MRNFLLVLLLLGAAPLLSQQIAFSEEMPQFPGGDDARERYFQDSIRYPEYELKNGISGTVYVYFEISKEGKIGNARVQRGVPGARGLEKEAVRVVMAMPDWTPGKMSGRPVKVSMTIPVKFVLPEQTTVTTDTPTSNKPDTVAAGIEDTTIYTLVDSMPRFPGGDAAFNKYLQLETRFPAAERKEKKEGTVYVSFVVEKDGSVSNVVLMKGVKDAPGFGTEAMRVISESPEWIPATLRGKAVRCKMALPIRFEL